MSTSPVLVPVSLVSQFLANEKMASRHWFQCQMECLLDQVFDQLSTKFEDYLASNALTGTAHHTTIDSDSIQHQIDQFHRFEPTFQTHSHPQFQTTTDHLINTEFSAAIGQSQNGSPMMNVNEQVNPNGFASEAVIFNQAQYPTSLSVPISNLEQSDPNVDEHGDYGFVGNDNQLLDEDIDNDATRVDNDEIEIKEEIDDSNDELIPSDHNSHIALPAFASVSNELLNHNLTSENDEEFDLDGGTRNDEQPSGLEYGDIDDDARMESDEVEVKEEIDDSNYELTIELPPENPTLLPVPALNCELSNGNVDDENCPSGNNLQQQNKHDDNDERIEHNEERSRSRKKPRLETTKPNNRTSRITRLSSRLANRNQTDQEQNINEQSNSDGRILNEQIEPTEDEVNNNQEKQIITLSLQCLETGCPLMFQNKTELNAHMNTQHQILQYQCAVKDCKQSFSNQYTLRDHIKQVHSHTTQLQWLCDKCAKYFPTYPRLSTHNYTYHQLGQYRCAAADCTFTGKHREKVYSHYKHHHKIAEIICEQPNCERRFKNLTQFKRHQRAHQGIKPFRCKWPDCLYASALNGNVIAHIKRKHLNRGSTETSFVDPREYLEVRCELL